MKVLREMGAGAELALKRDDAGWARPSRKRLPEGSDAPSRTSPDYFTLSAISRETGLAPDVVLDGALRGMWGGPVMTSGLRTRAKLFGELRPDLREPQPVEALRRDVRLLSSYTRSQTTLLPEGLAQETLEAALEAVCSVAAWDERVDTREEPRPRSTLVALRGLTGLSDLLRHESLVSRLGADGFAPEDVRMVGQAVENARALTALDLSRPDELPRRVRDLVDIWPETGLYLHSLRDQGLEVGFYDTERYPERLMDAVAELQAACQNSFVKDWLTELVMRKVAPGMTSSEESRLNAARLVHDSETPLSPERLEENVQLILDARWASSGFVVTGAPGQEEIASRAQGTLNGVLREFAGPLILRQTKDGLVFQNAKEQSESAVATVTAALFLAPAAQVLEQAGIGLLAKMLALATDDGLGAKANLDAIRDQMRTRIPLKFWAGMAPLAGFVAGSAGLTEELLDSPDFWVRMAVGADFGVAAVAFNFYVLGLAIVLRQQQNVRRAAAGSFPGHDLIPMVIAPTFQESLSNARSFPGYFGPEVLGQMIRLEFPESRELSAKARANVDETLSLLDAAPSEEQFQAVVQRMTPPTAAEVRRSTFNQEASIPFKVGMGVGGALAFVVGAIAAVTGALHNGFVDVGVGLMETVGAISLAALAGILVRGRAADGWDVMVAAHRENPVRPITLAPDGTPTIAAEEWW